MAARELTSAPGTARLYTRALTGSIGPALSRLPGVGGESEGHELPDTELVLPGVRIDPEHLAEYDRVCGFRLRDAAPATYPHVLAFPLQMELMTQSDFPFPVIGMVHIGNRIEQVRPVAPADELELRVRTERLADHERGTQFELVSEASAGGEVVWRGRSTYLHREGGGGSGGRDRERSEPPTPKAIWTIGDDVGRRYAAVSGDRNPIHLHSLSARLFGMPRAIAHGMWLKARCLAALEGHLPDAGSVDVRFKLPLLLPGKVAFSSWSEAGGRAFAVHDAKSGKPHLTGTAEPAR
jgi:acyl dehydratase